MNYRVHSKIIGFIFIIIIMLFICYHHMFLKIKEQTLTTKIVHDKLQNNYRELYSKIILSNQLKDLLNQKEKSTLIKQIVKEALKQMLRNYTIQSHSTVIPSTTIMKSWLHNKDNSHRDNNLSKRISKLRPFQIQITKSERESMYDLLDKFDRLMSKHKIIYFMYGGTLLGSYRHHDLIPWDDDLDVIVDVVYRKDMLKVFKELEPTYRLFRSSSHDKFYNTKTGKSIPKIPWKWPYVDISFYENVNKTHIKDWIKTYGKWYYYPKTITFPLHRRPLLNLSLPAPKDTFATLVWTYNFNSSCKMIGYSHMVETFGMIGSQDCKKFSDKFPFVHHLPVKNKKIGVREVLKYKDMVINDIIVDEPSYAVANTFNLSLKIGYKMPSNIKPLK